MKKDGFKWNLRRTAITVISERTKNNKLGIFSTFSKTEFLKKMSEQLMK